MVLVEVLMLKALNAEVFKEGGVYCPVFEEGDAGRGRVIHVASIALSWNRNLPIVMVTVTMVRCSKKHGGDWWCHVTPMVVSWKRNLPMVMVTVTMNAEKGRG